MKIYLDNCCLNRPFDSMSNDVVRMEAEAVMTIIGKCGRDEWHLCSSDILIDEIDMNPDYDRKQKVFMMLSVAEYHIDLTDSIEKRAREFQEQGMKPYDALHLASAEEGGADIFLTTDRKFINAANRSDAGIDVKNPLLWLAEVLNDE